jgi:hypothetical protein
MGIWSSSISVPPPERPRRLDSLSLDTDGESRNVRGFASAAQARSSVEEHYLDTVGVGGSIPPVPTTSAQALVAAKLTKLTT